MCDPEWGFRRPEASGKANAKVYPGEAENFALITMGAPDRTDRLHYEQLLRIDRIERFTTNVQYTIHNT